MVKATVKNAANAAFNFSFKKLSSSYKWMLKQPFNEGVLDLPRYVGCETKEEQKAVKRERLRTRGQNTALRYKRAREIDPLMKRKLQAVYDGLPSNLVRKTRHKMPVKPEFERMPTKAADSEKARIKAMRNRVNRAYRRSLKEAKAERRGYYNKRLRLLIRATEDVATFLDGSHNSRLKRAHEIELNTRKQMRKYLDSVFEGDQVLLLDFDNFFHLHPLDKKQHRIKKYAEMFVRAIRMKKPLENVFKPFLKGKILPYKDIIAHVYSEGIECGFKEQKRTKKLDLRPVWENGI